MRNVWRWVCWAFLALFLAASASVGYYFYNLPSHYLLTLAVAPEYSGVSSWTLRQGFYAFHPKPAAVDELNEYAAARYAALLDNQEEAERMLDHLLAHGVDINSRATHDPDIRYTALHSVVFRRDEAGAKLLLSRGADPTIENHRGDTPLDLARHLDERGRYDDDYGPVIEVLEDAQRDTE